MQIIIKEISIDKLVEVLATVVKNNSYMFSSSGYFDPKNEDFLRESLIKELSKRDLKETL